MPAYAAKFAVAVTVPCRPHDTRNVLGNVLEGWFGSRAGQPGTSHAVVFERTGERYTMSPACNLESARDQRDLYARE